MSNPLYKFGPYDFEDDAESLSWDVPVNTPSYELGREDGSRHGGATLINRRIKLEGFIYASSFADWRTKKDTLMKALFPTPRMQRLTTSDDRAFMG
jgi:hypothetical protein